MKICANCYKKLPFDSFYFDKKNNSYKSRCKTCILVKSDKKKAYQLPSEEDIEAQRKSVLTDVELYYAKKLA